MASAILGKTGNAVSAASHVCVKTGRPTHERVTLRGSTTPGWVNLLLIFSVFGWIFAMGMTERRFVVTVPFTHAVHDRWQRLNWLAWGLGVGGIALTFWAAFTSADRVLLPLAVTLGAFVLGLANSWINNVGVRQGHDDALLLVRVHPAAASAIASVGAAMDPTLSNVEPVTP